jgi:hypothetical protein
MGTHPQDFIVGFSFFMASFNNRQCRGTEFLIFLKLNLKFLYPIGFFANTALSLKTQRLLCVFSGNA